MKTHFILSSVLLTLLPLHILQSEPQRARILDDSRMSRAEASERRPSQLREPSKLATQTIAFEKTEISIVATKEATVERRIRNYPTSSWNPTSFCDEVQLVLPAVGRIWAWSSDRGSADLQTRLERRVALMKKRAADRGDYYFASAITPFKTESGISGLTYYSESKPPKGCVIGQARSFFFYTENGRYIMVTAGRGGPDKAVEKLDHPLNKMIVSGLKLNR